MTFLKFSVCKWCIMVRTWHRYSTHANISKTRSTGWELSVYIRLIYFCSKTNQQVVRWQKAERVILMFLQMLYNQTTNVDSVSVMSPNPEPCHVLIYFVPHVSSRTSIRLHLIRNAKYASELVIARFWLNYQIIILLGLWYHKSILLHK